MSQQNLLRFPAVRRSDWSNDELSELYRVQNALQQAGIEVQIEKGQTDEGDPWFVFCRTDGEIVVQIARSGGVYFLYASVLSEPLVGSNFSELAKRLVDLMPAPIRPSTGSLFLHPSSLLSILVASLFVTSDLMNSSSAFAGASSDSDFQAIADRIVYPAAPAAVAVSDDAATLGKAMSQSAVVSKVQDHFGQRGGVDRREGAQAQQLPAILSETLVLGAYIAARLTATNLTTDSSNTVALTRSATVGSSNASLAEFAVVAESQSFSPSDHVAQVMPTGFAQANPPSSISPAFAAMAPMTMADRQLDAPPASAQLIPAIFLGLPVETGHALPSGQPMLVHQAVSSGSPGHAAQRAPNANTGPVSVSSDDGQMAVELGGGATIRVSDAALTESALMSFQLRINSVGQAANVVYISDDVLEQRSSVDMIVTGSQDLEIHESVSVFLRSTLDTSNFNANLSLGIVFGNNTSSIERLNLGTSNFDIRPGDSISLYELPDETSIQVNSSVNIFSMVAVGAATTRDASLTLDLSSAISGKSLALSEVKVFGADTLHIQSLSGPDAEAVHTIGRLRAADLSDLSVSGTTDLVISEFEVAATNTSDLTFDASALTASFSLHLSDFDSGRGRGRDIDVLASQDGTTISDANANHRVSFVGGDGADTLIISAGERNDTVREFDGDDQIMLNGWSILQEVTEVSTLVASLQNIIDSQSRVADAARAAALPHVSEHSEAEGATAWLFTYRDATYVFADVRGDGTFNADTDAVIQLVGYQRSQPIDATL